MRAIEGGIPGGRLDCVTGLCLPRQRSRSARRRGCRRRSHWVYCRPRWLAVGRAGGALVLNSPLLALSLLMPQRLRRVFRVGLFVVRAAFAAVCSRRARRRPLQRGRGTHRNRRCSCQGYSAALGCRGVWLVAAPGLSLRPTGGRQRWASGAICQEFGVCVRFFAAMAPR